MDDQAFDDRLLYRDKRIGRFASGERVKAFHAFEEQAKKRLSIRFDAMDRTDLMRLPSNHFEALGGDRKDLYSIRSRASDGSASNGQTGARALHVPPNRLYQLIAGKRALTADTARRLEPWPGVSAGFWMNLQMRSEPDLATEKIGDEIERTVIARPVADIPSGSTTIWSSLCGWLA